MKNSEKYRRSYFLPGDKTYDWVKKDFISKAPIWCSVDLRDGNQALIEPMSLNEKLEFFNMLTGMGFKEIEVGFPASSDTEFEFVRTLIEKKLIPDDVTIQVLTQARDHIIEKTFESIKGVKKAIVHLYNSTSITQREQVFKMSKAQVKEVAEKGARLVKELAYNSGSELIFEYSPESFHGTEIEYALEICNSVIDIWKEDAGRKIIINIPTTVENAMPHVFASQIEYLKKNLNHAKDIILSVHTHNDRGCAVAASELALIAGAGRVEGTLFGNGERSGNVDLAVLALNMYSQGVDPGLDFSDLPSLKSIYERLSGMNVPERTPYSGALVFSSFSGSHQDAISKGLNYYEKNNKRGGWNVPYLPIDPSDIGRSYEGDVIRINSQSGKGGVSYILQTVSGIIMPKALQEEFSYYVKGISDREHKELHPDRIYQLFEDRYLRDNKHFFVTDYHFKKENGIIASITIEYNGNLQVIQANGNGRIDAVSNCLKQYFGFDYKLCTYEEYALDIGSNARTCAYVAIQDLKKNTFWGAGINEDLVHSTIDALCVAVNHYMDASAETFVKDERINRILNYIQDKYKTVTLDDLSREFYLSKPYLSKYIKEKSGATFGENVKSIRLKKAAALLRGGNLKVERIAEMTGYPNVEHFNRLFKKRFKCTPIQYRTGKVE